MAETVEKTPVTLTDGRVVGFGKRQKLNKESTINEETGEVTVRLDFRNGETRTFTLPPSLILKFAAHGAEQKLGDAIAGETDDGDAVVAIDDMITRLSAGEWTAPRKSGEFKGASILLKALVEASGRSVEDIRAFLATKSAADKAALRRSDKLRPIIERMEAEKAAKSTSTVDTDALLGELQIS